MGVRTHGLRLVIVVLAVATATCGTTAADPATSNGTSEATSADSLTPGDRDSWPTDGWLTSTPEAQGMDSQRLIDMLELIQRNGYEIDSVTVIRNGYVVLDATKYPFSPNMMHIIHSCTKSVVSTLIGIAVEAGHLESVAIPVVELLPDAAPATIEPYRAAMTLEDLLTMSTGLRCRDSYLYAWRGLGEMIESTDWAAHVLSLPMVEEPGTRFEYCNGSSYLLSAIITAATGQSAADYAADVLFAPLGIVESQWPANVAGVNHGWGDMFLHRHDMAKLGYLYLNDGWWDGVRVLPEGWVEAATTPHVAAGTLAPSYGYQWWVDDGFYAAVGFGGQFIYVVPESDLVAVFTSGLSPTTFERPEQLLRDFILGAVKGTEALADDPVGEARLATLVAELAAAPEPTPPGPLSEAAAAVAGARYLFEDDEGDFASFELEFEQDEARLRLEARDGPIDVAVGLDGVPRFSDALGGRWAFTGRWTTDAHLTLEWQIIGLETRGTMDFQFVDDRARVQFLVATSGEIDVGNARRER